MMSEAVYDEFILGILEIFFLDPRIEGREVFKPLHQILHIFLAPRFFLIWSQFETRHHLYRFFAIRFHRRCQLKYLPQIFDFVVRRVSFIHPSHLKYLIRPVGEITFAKAHSVCREADFIVYF